MKFILALSFFISTSVLANPCNGAVGAFHTNPDSSIGGFVAATATAAPTAYIGMNSEVCQTAKVLGSAVVLGTSRILQSARIEDSATIENAIVRDQAKSRRKRPS